MFHSKLLPLALPGAQIGLQKLFKNEGGQIASALLGPLGVGLMDAFGLGAQDNSFSNQSGQWTNALNNLKKAQTIASWSAAGFEGADADRMAQLKANELVNTNSADAIAAQNRLNNLGSSALGSAEQSNETALRLLGQQSGTQFRDIANAIKMSAGGPAAIAGAARNLGSANSQALQSLAAQSAQNAQQGIQTAGGMFTGAEQVRQQDLATRLKLFEPYAVQKYSGANLGAAGQAAQGFSQATQIAKIAEDPLAPTKAMAGNISGQALEKSQAADEIATALKLRGFTIDDATLEAIRSAIYR